MRPTPTPPPINQSCALSCRYFHAGVDYGADVGEDVVMPGGGRVALVGREEDGFVVHGNCVGVDHGCGLTSIFMHLTTVCVR